MNWPFSCGICGIQRELHLNNLTILFSQLSRILSVKHYQLWQGSKLLSSIQIIKISRVLDFYVCNLSFSPVDENNSTLLNNSLKYYSISHILHLIFANHPIPKHSFNYFNLLSPNYSWSKPVIPRINYRSAGQKKFNFHFGKEKASVTFSPISQIHILVISRRLSVLPMRPEVSVCIWETTRNFRRVKR